MRFQGVAGPLHKPHVLMFICDPLNILKSKVLPPCMLYNMLLNLFDPPYCTTSFTIGLEACAC